MFTVAHIKFHDDHYKGIFIYRWIYQSVKETECKGKSSILGNCLIVTKLAYICEFYLKP